MRDQVAEFKALRLHGMLSTCAEARETDGGANKSMRQTRSVIERRLDAEHTDHALRSRAHQMANACFPAHRDLAGFEFEGARVDRLLIEALASLEFTEAAHNVVFIGGPDIGHIWLRRWV